MIVTRISDTKKSQKESGKYYEKGKGLLQHDHKMSVLMVELENLLKASVLLLVPHRNNTEHPQNYQ